MKSDWLYELPDRPFNEARTWLVVGSAGAGKSTVIRRVIDTLIDDGVQPAEILYTLFNKEPADEFKAKYFARGHSSDDLRWWGTHHSIMKRAMGVSSKKLLSGKTLVEWGKKYGFDFALDKQSPTNWDRIFNGLSAKLYSGKRNFSRVEQRLLKALNESEGEGYWTHVRYLVAGCVRGIIPPGIKYVFVDEAQDNGLVQMQWVQSLVDNEDIKGVMLAGDDKQAINLFKGSDPKLFLDFPVDRQVVLRKTFRCPLNILKEANRIVYPIKKRSPLSDESNKTESGIIARGGSLDCLASQIRKELVEGRSVLALTRDNFTKTKLIRKALSLGLIVATPDLLRITQTIKALKHIKDTGKMTDIDMFLVVPTGKMGQLKQSAYWDRGMTKTLTTGAFRNDPSMLEAYKMARFMDGLPLEDTPLLGFHESFVEDVRGWKIPFDKWNLSREAVGTFKRMVKDSGMGFGTLRVSTIHSVKGMEEDNVLLCTDISGAARRSELETPDDERRVWYVAMTRTKNNLFITQIDQTKLRTMFVC